MKILIVDDDPFCRRMLKTIIASEPDQHQITEAADGNEAWSLLNNTSRYFDVVFLDVSMPPPDGLKLLGLIRESPLLRSVRVVMCTAASDKVTVENVIQLGARHFIVKPATAPLIQNKLKQLQAEIAEEAAKR